MQRPRIKRGLFFEVRRMADNGYQSSDIDYSGFYTGSMDPNKPYVMTPGAVPYNTNLPLSTDRSSPEQEYERIYGEPLSTRSVKSTPINPSTGMPYKTTVSGTYGGSVGHGYSAQGSVDYMPPRTPAQANPLPGVRDLGSPQYGPPGIGGGVLTKSGLPPGATVDNKSLARLPALPGLSVGDMNGSGRGRLGASGFGSGSLTAKASDKSSGGVIKLVTEPMSEVSGQNTANSFGKPVRGPSGKTYYPSNTPMSGVRAPYDPKGAEKYSGKMGQDNRGPLSQLLGLKTSGLGGLLGGLFGGMQQRQGLGALLGMVPGIGAAAAPPTPQFYSNGVANPDYRNYSPGQSEGGGVMPSSSYSGGFTDSLGGTYYDRHL